MPVPAIPLRRRSSGRVVAGVASGLGDHLQIDPLFVRLGFVVLTPAGGLGIVLYLALWTLVPKTPDGDLVAPSSAPIPRDRESAVVRGISFGSIVLGFLLLIQRTGIWFPTGLVIPLVLTSIGLAMTREGSSLSGSKTSAKGTDPAERLQGLSERGLAGLVDDARRFVTDDSWSRQSMGRVVAGAVLMFLGVATFLASTGSVAAFRQGLLAAMVLIAGFGLLVAPWLVQVSRQTAAERNERIRSDERALMAAHLHDSVLQTLAIIQKKATSPRDVVTIARRQERELRSWLYGGTEAVHDLPQTLGQAIAAATDSVESDHGVVIDLVQVGDAAVCAEVVALVAATREALVNAAKHSQRNDVSVFVEVEDRAGSLAIECFVRDRGVGFDPATIPSDRRGIRNSLRQRMERVGGRVNVISSPGEGTEVQIRVEIDRDRAADQTSTDAPQPTAAASTSYASPVPATSPGPSKPLPPLEPSDWSAT